MLAGIIAKFDGANLVICCRSGEGKTWSYSQINTLMYTGYRLWCNTVTVYGIKCTFTVYGVTYTILQCMHSSREEGVFDNLG